MLEGESAPGVAAELCMEGDSGALLPLLMSSIAVVIVDVGSAVVVVAVVVVVVVVVVVGTVTETTESDNVPCTSGAVSDVVVNAAESFSLAISSPAVGVAVEVTPVMGDADDPDFI